MRYTAIFLSSLIVTSLLFFSVREDKAPFRLPDPEYEDIPVEWPTKTYDVLITVYNPVEAQCDDTPYVTASNARIDMDRLRRGELRWCAVSRDLLEIYPYGSTIDVWIAPNHEYNGTWVVMDTMQKRMKYHIDLLTYDRTSGKWNGQIK